MKRILNLLLYLLVCSSVAHSQIVSGNAFLKGNYVEVGLSPAGSFGTNVNAPAGYHPRALSYGNNLGFVADSDQDGWSTGAPNYCGDYFLPGSPEEGWAVKFNGTSYNNNRRGYTFDIPGSITGYNNNGVEVSAEWTGSIGNLDIQATTRFPINALYFVTDVTVTNSGGSTLSNVYYMRNVDPDQDWAVGGNAVTVNTIVSQNPNATNTALISSLGPSYGCYTGIGSKDCRARVSRGGFSNRNPEHVWNGTGGLSSSGSITADQAISIAFFLGDLAPGQTEIFSYAYVLSESQLTPALAETEISFFGDNVLLNSGSSTPTCSGEVFPLSIVNTTGYNNWSWSPSTGLNTTSGTSVEATLSSSQTYTASGSGLCGTIDMDITLNPASLPTPDDAGPITSSAGSCVPVPTNGVTLSVAPITNATSYIWSVPTGAGIVSGGSSNSIIVNFGPTYNGGHFEVVGHNACGDGAFSSLILNECGSAGSLRFDGVNDVVDIPARMPIANGAPWSVSVWVNPDFVNDGDVNPIIAQYQSGGTNGRTHIYENAGYYKFFYGHSSGNMSGDFGTATTTWTHLCATYDGTNVKLYQDGNLSTTLGGLSGGILNTDTRLGKGGNLSTFYDGGMDEVRFWDYALCEQEVQGTMNCELTGTESGLISYYKFNQGFTGANNSAIDYLTDETGNVDGSLDNFALTGGISNWDIQCPDVSSVCGPQVCTNVWTGSASTLWANTGNWSNGVLPTFSDDAFIPSTPSGGNMPTVFTDVAQVDDLEIESGATVTIADGGTLGIDQVLTNNGTVNVNNGGSLLQLTGSTIAGSGTYNVQRQGATGERFNFWSSPITNNSGVPGNSYSYNPNTGTQADSDDNPSDPGWSSYNGTMNPGTGYAGSGGGLVTFSGTVNNGDIDEPLFYYPFDGSYTQTTAGTPFNLVGNPYPSAISSSSLIADNPDIDGTIYFWDDDLSGGTDYHRSDFAYWNGTGGLGSGAGSVGAPGNSISATQGFYVRATTSSSPTLHFNNGQRVIGPNSQFFRTNGEDSRLWFSVETDSLFNQILIGALEDASEDEDRLYDAVKMRSSNGISLSALGNDVEHAIMAFPPPTAQKTIPLRVNTEETGTHIFKAQTIENFEQFALFLDDAQTGLSYPINEGIGISISLEEGEHLDRFYINLVRTSFTGIDESQENELSVFASNGLLHVGCSKCSPGAVIEMLDMSGRVVHSEIAPRFNEGLITIPLHGISKGVYVVKVTTQNQMLTQKIINQ